MATHKNMLKLHEAFALSKWLKANKKKIEDDALNAGETTVLAEKELQFTINERNLKSVIEGSGINIKFPRRGARKSNSELTNKLNVLVHELKLSWQEMGYTTSKPFKDVFGE